MKKRVSTIRNSSQKCHRQPKLIPPIIPLSPSQSKAIKCELMAPMLSPSNPTPPASSNPTLRPSLTAPPCSSVASSPPLQLYTFTDNRHDTELATVPPLNAHVTATSLSTGDLRESSDTLQTAYSKLDGRTHANRLKRQEKMMSNKGTKVAYNHHLQNYERFWTEAQSEDLSLGLISAHPITAAKVSLFLEHEASQLKRKARTGEEIQESSVGHSHISQVINSLERHRKDHQHELEYQVCAESLIPLRRDIRISTYEKGSRADEPKRVQEAHALKATGVSSDTYDDEQLVRLSMRAIFSSVEAGDVHATPLQMYAGLRDRAMILLSSSIAFHGDSARSLLWSDLELRNIPMINIGLDAKAVIFLADQGKTNKDGHLEEHAAFRHRVPELCSVGAVAFLFFGYFHVLSKSIPDFAPDFSVGEYGRRKWYNFHVFNNSSRLEDEMSYDNHHKRVKELYEREGISITKVTHAGRKFAGTWSRYHGSSHEDTKALGNWASKTDGSMPLYVDALPIPSMLSMSGWNGSKQESYILVRGGLDVPRELIKDIFPWVEVEQAALESRKQQLGRKAEDPRLCHLLNLLIFFRTIILQDATVLYAKYPNCPLFEYHPFDTPLFHTFATSSIPRLEAAELEGRHRLENLPEQFSSSLCGIVTTFALENQKLNHVLQEHTDMLKTMESHFMAQETSNEARPRKRRKVGHAESLHARKTISRPSPTPFAPSSAATVETLPTDPDPNPPPPLPISEITISNSGELYSVAVFRLSEDQHVQDLQLKGIDTLEAEFGATQLRCHSFRWTISDASDVSDEWRPSYEFYQPGGNKQATVEEIWKEWSVGINGCISVERLSQYWDTRWRRSDKAKKTMASRRKRIIDIMMELISKRGWDEKRALRFIRENYVPVKFSTVRGFIDYLQKREKGVDGLTNSQRIVENAM